MAPLSEKAHIAQQLMENIQGLPLWVKQVIYLELRNDLAAYFVPESLNNLTSEDTIAFFVPRLTEEGERMLLETKGDMGTFLMEAKQRYSTLDICLRQEWSLEATCQHLMSAIRSGWVKAPNSLKAMGTIEYISNSIRLGEYLVKMGRITPDQLEQALRTQHYIKEALQEHTGLANILINLGYITRQDTEGILFLKEESLKPFSTQGLLEKLG